MNFLFKGLSEQEAAEQWESRNRFFDQFLIFDGDHFVNEELKKARKKGLDLDYELLGIDAIRKVYKFNNGYGASIVRGSFTFNYWEMAVIKFTFFFPRNKLPKKKRIKNKWIKKYAAGYDITYNTSVSSDVERYANFAAVEKDLERIMSL